MKLYHYATWSGHKIKASMVLRPSIKYGFGNTTVLLPWPEVVFLTTNPHWEPSIQAKSKEGYWEKCQSDPKSYEELGIPCWKFTVHAHNVEVRKVTDYIMLGEKWRYMLADAIKLNSDIDQWYISDSVLDVTIYEGLNRVALTP